MEREFTKLSTRFDRQRSPEQIAKSMRPKSWKKMEAVIRLLSTDHYRYPTSYKIESNNNWFTPEDWNDKRSFVYFSELLCEAGIASMKIKIKGCYAWKLFKLNVSQSDALFMLKGLPF